MGHNSSQIRETEGYEIVEQLPIGNIVKSVKDQTLYFLKECSFTAQQAYHNALNAYSLKLANKNQHILNFQHFTTKSENSFCSTFHKIMLIYQYIDYSLADEIEVRLKEQRPFTEKEIWSVLCSCVLAAVHLINTEGRMHCGLTTKDIRLTSNGCVKLLSHEMIGIDTVHALTPAARQEGLPRALAMTLIECFTQESSTRINQDSSYLSGIIEALECSRQMKQILRLMTNSDIKFLQLQEHLFKLVQEDESMESQSTTPVLKAQSPINAQYQCPKIHRHDFSERQYPQDKINRSIHKSRASKCQSKTQTHMLQPAPSDCEDRASSRFPFQCQIIEQQSPDEGEEEKNIEDRNCKQVERFVLTQNTHCVGENRLGTDSQSKHDNQASQDQYGGRYQLSQFAKESNARNKENESNRDIRAFSETETAKQYKIRDEIRDEINNRGVLTNKHNKDNLFTDPKLFSMIKSDLKEIEMRKSMVMDQQKKNHYGQEERNWVPSRPPQQPQQPDKEVLSQHNSQTAMLEDHRKLPSNLNTQTIEMIRECSQQYRDEEQSLQNTFKSKRSTANNIMCDDQLGLKRKKKTERNQSARNILERDHESSRDGKAEIQRVTQEIIGCRNDCEEIFSKDTRQMAHKYARLNSENSFEREGEQTGKCRTESQEKLTKVSEHYHKGKYQGTKLNGKRHGYGAFYYSEGGKYVGNWRQNKMHGRGTLYYPNQEIAYEGEWENDQLCGFGVLFNQEVAPLRNPFDYRDWSEVEDYWVKYQGHFEEDNKEGKGKLYLANGERLQAEFHKDMVDGDGTLYKDDGSSIRGRWKKNVLVKLF